MSAAIDLNRLPPDVAASMRAQMPPEPRFPVAFAETVTGPVTRVKSPTWRDLTTLLGNVRTGAKDGPLWIAGDHPPGPRGNEQVRSVSVLALDIEAKTVSDPVTHVKTTIGPEPPSVSDMAAELGLRGWRGVIHTTYSHRDPAILPADVEHHRYRVVLALSRPLKPSELPILGAHAASVMGVADCSDPSVLRPSQPLYLPRCPADRLAMFERVIIDGEPLGVDQALDDARRATEALKRATKQRQGTAAGSVIEAFNAAHDVGSILVQHGYVPRGRGRWMHPESSTRTPGIRLLPDSDPPRVFSSHGCCPLNDGKAHDAFSAWLVLVHDRDMTRAVREAARLLGMDHNREESRQSSGPAEPEDKRADSPASDPAKVNGATKTTVGITTANRFKVEPIRWIWRGWIAAGKVHILAGAPGTGKTSISMAITATITLGGRWPDGTTADPGHVVIWSGEDDPSDTLIPRLIAAGADLSKVHVVTGAQDKGGSRSFDPAGDVLALAETLAEMTPPPVLLIVDPIVSAVAGDSHKNAEVRRALQPLVDLAMIRRVAVLGITHFSKGSAGRDPVERVTGSLAFGALARIVMAAAKRSEDDGGGRILARGKSNIGRDDGGYLYDFEVCEALPGIETTRILWGDPIEGTARELLGSADAATDPEERSMTSEAMDFLRAHLATGPSKAKEVQKEAREAGISEKTLRTARERLGIKPTKSGFSSGWFWEMPRQDAPASSKMPNLPDVSCSDTEGNMGILGQDGQVRQDRKEHESMEIDDEMEAF